MEKAYSIRYCQWHKFGWDERHYLGHWCPKTWANNGGAKYKKIQCLNDYIL